ncbi:serine hydrolase domain-containing protein [Halalkalibacillus halophilus]|uniref:serine hydrolase domain-containing protein n=1 Tax=Halalkalibacillus halophilus TaxID=392827 RepID=UPI000405B477|nr:serine hydrolase [Halalkalibacillus halophilus]
MQFDRVERILEEAVENGRLPGFAVAVVSSDQIYFEKYSGILHQNSLESVTDDSLFDLASLTKVVATLPAILKLVGEGQVVLTDLVKDYLPDFESEEITVKDLLQHRSGLPAHIPFHEEKITARHQVIEKINEQVDQMEGERKVIYSDLNFILLKFLAEEVSGEDFEAYVSREIFQTLQMHTAMFNPLEKGFAEGEIAATEQKLEGSSFIRGEVHDENARSFEGVSGHAGLFSRLSDLIVYAQAWLRREAAFSSEELLQQTMTDVVHGKQTRGLGWQFNRGIEIMGRNFSAESFGHTGFTGTSIWFDESLRFAVVLLTNRVHFGRSNDISGLRKELHDEIYSVMGSGE